MTVRKANVLLNDISNKRVGDYLYPYLAPLLFLNLSIYFINNPELAAFNTSHSMIGSAENKTSVVHNAESANVNPKPTTQNHEFSVWEKELNGKFTKSYNLNFFTTSVEKNEFIIEFGSASLFNYGKAEIQRQSIRELIELSKYLVDNASNYNINIESYTDDSPVIKNTLFYPTNWELTGARASRVVRLLTSLGFNSEQIKYTGFGSSKAKYPNKNENGRPIYENRRKNRRFIIRVSAI